MLSISHFAGNGAGFSLNGLIAISLTRFEHNVDPILLQF
jgi:hypothetical protein